jgi:hypothetical protein
MIPRLEPTEGFEPSSLPYRGSMSIHDHQMGTYACVGIDGIEPSTAAS